MIKRLVKRIIHKHRGFALSELLISIVIVSLAGLIICEGLSLAANSFVETSDRTCAKLIIDNYETIISNTLSNSRFLKVYNDKPLFESSDLSMSGYFDVKDGCIVFIPVKVDYFGNILETDDSVDLIPKRNLYGNNIAISKDELGSKYKLSIDYKYDESGKLARYDITIRLKKDLDEIVSRSFFVYEEGEIVKS